MELWYLAIIFVVIQGVLNTIGTLAFHGVKIYLLVKKESRKNK